MNQPILDDTNKVEVNEKLLGEMLTRLDNVERQPIAQATESAPILKGNRTKLSNLIQALIPIAMVFGVNIDPDAAVEWIQKLDGVIAFGTAACVWFVNKFYELKGTDK